MGNEAASDDRTPCRRTRRGEERCERVRAVATELFLANGYDGVSLDDIIAQSGGSKTNIYSHFGGKEGLFIGAVEGLCDEVNASIEAVDVTGASLEEGLRKLGRALLEVVLGERHLALYRLVIGQSGRFPCLGHAWTTHGPDATRQILAQFLAGHRQRLDDLPPEEAAILFHNMLTWDRLNRAVFGLGTEPCRAGIAKHVDETIALFVQGFVRP
jgi:AcrR family transcriptional regulator